MENRDSFMNDDVEKRVIERLNERGRKLSMMKKWEEGSKRKYVPLYSALALVASVALLLVISLGRENGNVLQELGIEAPCMEAYRSGVPQLENLDNLLNNGQYYEAVEAAEKALENSDMLIQQMESSRKEGDEEWEYQYVAEKTLNSEIRWTYIYALIMVESEKMAVKQLKKYLKDEEYCTHKEEAESMLKAL
jgi:redox-regulated HSP33 family molecular chaperone